MRCWSRGVIARTLDARRTACADLARGMSAAACCSARSRAPASPAGCPSPLRIAFPDLSNHPLVGNGLRNREHPAVLQRRRRSPRPTVSGARSTYVTTCTGSGVRGRGRTGADTGTRRSGPNTPATIKPADPPAPDWKPRPGEFLPLPPAHKINLPAGMVRGVGLDPAVGMFACSAGEHGFVFTRTATRLF